MKKTSCLAALILLLCLQAPPALAIKQTSYTYTLNDSGRFTRTQDAYLPDKTITGLGLNKPEDIFFDAEGFLYIADTANRRVIKYDPRTGIAAGELKHADFKTPRGLYISSAGDLYVADSGARAVFRFDRDFRLLQTFERPGSPVFADTNYEPIKVAADSSGGLYIISEGVYSGVIQLAPSGEFLGYFTVNKTRPSLRQMIQRIFFTDEQLKNVTDLVPTTFSNVFADHQGIIYTTTIGSTENGLKKHNTSGGNMFVQTVYGWSWMTDVYADRQGLIYVANDAGYIDIYSSTGEWVFEFGSYVSTLDISGLFSKLPAIAVSPDGDIWAVDGVKGYLQSFTRTEYAATVYKAMDLYEQGRYDDSLSEWTKALRLNQMSVLAHNGVGKALFHAQRYEESMAHFKVSGNRTYYSEAFWEVRNAYLQRLLGPAAAGGLALGVTRLLYRRLRKNRGPSLLKRVWRRLLGARGTGPVLWALSAARHPIDSYYEIRRSRRGSLPGATALYGMMFIMFMLYSTSKGFIYQFERIENIDVGALAGGYFLIIGLFIVCNYLASSINDGDGSFRQVYMIPAYAMAPLLIAMAVNFGLSYLVTYSESFILSLIEGAGIAWSAALLFLGLMGVHDYTFKETLRSILLTAVFMLIAALLVMILTIMWEQLYQFLGTLTQEVIRNALD